VEKIQCEFRAAQFQMFDLNVLKEWPASYDVKSPGVCRATDYLAKHRVSAAVKREIRRLDQGS
jgi:hypothetical protein